MLLDVNKHSSFKQIKNLILIIKYLTFIDVKL